MTKIPSTVIKILYIRNGGKYMNESIKEKVINRAVYIILAALLITVLTLTVIGIVSTVSKRNDIPVDTVPEDTVTPPSDEPPSDATPPTTEQKPEEVPSDTPLTPEPVKPVYVAPCEGGFIQKGHDETLPVFSATMCEHRLHLGVDISGKVGDAVRVFADGTVEKIEKDYFWGQTVVVDHGNGLKSYYMNLSETLAEGIEVGKRLTAGAVIGAIGETANIECADSPHLHFELRLGDKPVNPTDYVPLPEAPTSSEDFEE